MESGSTHQVALIPLCFIFYAYSLTANCSNCNTPSSLSYNKHHPLPCQTLLEEGYHRCDCTTAYCACGTFNVASAKMWRSGAKFTTRRGRLLLPCCHVATSVLGRAQEHCSCSLPMLCSPSSGQSKAECPGGRAQLSCYRASPTAKVSGKQPPCTHCDLAC